MFKSKRIISFLSATLLTCSSQLYADEHEHEHEEHEVHVHGEAQLLIAVEGSTLEIEFHSPAMNIVGFEHKPANETQHQAVDAVIATLKNQRCCSACPQPRNVNMYQ